MKHFYQALCCMVVLSLCVGQLFAQQGYLKLPGSGLQAYKNPRAWHGLDLKEFFGSQNTATGSGALPACTSCYQNVADGYQALNTCTTCCCNVGVGFQTLALLTTGSSNTAVGWAALDVSTASFNTAFGYGAMENNTTGGSNTAVGASSLGASTGANNTAMGFGTLGNAYGESNSIAIGYLASFNSNSSTGYNTVIGTQALYGSSQSTGNTGSDNLVAGAKAMYYNTSGSNNAALGFEAMYENTTGTGNAAMGDNAMPANTSGSYNQAAGDLALFSNTTGSENAGSGAGVLEDNTTGNFNVAMGYLTLYENTTGSYNTALGTFANTSTSGLSNATALGSDATVTASNKVVIGSTSVTSIGGYAGWSNFSDGRYKKNIQQNVPGLAFINKLNPITYTLDVDGIETKLHENDKQSADKKLPSRPSYLDDPVMKQAVQEKSAIIYTGFVAQDVEKAADSVGFTFSGVDKPKDVNQSFYGLRYSDFVVPLVKAVQELSASSNSKDSAINVLQGRFDSLQSQVNELRALLLAKNTTAMSGASLDQNMPNPFNGATIIGYNLPKGATSAQMQITDITGKVLAVIPLSGEGKSSVTANISGYAAGIYTYSLIVNGQIVGTKEMTAIR